MVEKCGGRVEKDVGGGGVRVLGVELLDMAWSSRLDVNGKRFSA